MTLSEMTTRVRNQLPAATVESVSDDIIWRELNIAVNECNRLSQVYQGYTEFTTVVDKQIYNFSTYVPLYLGMAKDGVWFNNSGTSLKELFPKTIRWLDLWIRNWRDLTSGEPQWYWVLGDDLGLYPKPSTAATLRVYHLKKATAMDNANNYPWTNTTTEVTALQAFDKPITTYARWALTSAVGVPTNEDPLYKRFLLEVKLAKEQTNRRPDWSSHWDSPMRIDTNAR